MEIPFKFRYHNQKTHWDELPVIYRLQCLDSITLDKAMVVASEKAKEFFKSFAYTEILFEVDSVPYHFISINASFKFYSSESVWKLYAASYFPLEQRYFIGKTPMDALEEMTEYLHNQNIVGVVHAEIPF